MSRHRVETTLIFALTLVGAGIVQVFAEESTDNPRKNPTSGQQRTTQWIWSPAHAKDQIPVGDCFFRKSFRLVAPTFGQVQICCDNRYELYVNGARIGEGNDWRTMDVYNVTSQLRKGRNVVAVKATNVDEGAAGLAVRIVYQEEGSPHARIVSDATWRTSVQQADNWWAPVFRDTDWLAALLAGEEVPNILDVPSFEAR